MNKSLGSFASQFETYETSKGLHVTVDGLMRVLLPDSKDYERLSTATPSDEEALDKLHEAFEALPAGTIIRHPRPMGTSHHKKTEEGAWDKITHNEADAIHAQRQHQAPAPEF